MCIQTDLKFYLLPQLSSTNKTHHICPSPDVLPTLTSDDNRVELYLMLAVTAFEHHMNAGRQESLHLRVKLRFSNLAKVVGLVRGELGCKAGSQLFVYHHLGTGSHSVSHPVL
jgi:hypothetical protein